MKRLIKGLYIAFFPEQYERERNRIIDDLNARLKTTEDMLLASESMGELRITREAIYKYAVAINQLREAEEEKRKLWADCLSFNQRKNLSKFI